MGLGPLSSRAFFFAAEHFVTWIEPVCSILALNYYLGLNLGFQPGMGLGLGIRHCIGFSLELDIELSLYLDVESSLRLCLELALEFRPVLDQNFI